MATDKDKSLIPVGYKRPPEHTRFKRGQSGNPGGRPKRPPSLQADLETELNRPSTTRDVDSKRFITRQRAMIRELVNAALAGDLRAVAIVTDLSANKFAVLEGADDLAPSEEDLLLLRQYVDREIDRRENEHKK